MNNTDNIKDTSTQQDYWTDRYQNQNTGWDIGYPSTPIKEYFDALEDKSLSILIPGAGNAYEAEYLFRQGFQKVHVLDIALPPLEAFQQRVPNFPKEQLIHGNFFDHEGEYDYIVEQTFFCSFTPTPENRHAYAQKMFELLKPNGKLVGLWFNYPIYAKGGRPYGGSLEEYLGYFETLFDIISFQSAHNSIPPRMGKELFGIMQKKG